eukprot:gene17889-19671_t
MSSTKSNSKNWLKKTVTKPWKKRLFVFCKEEENSEHISLVAYEKEEHEAKQKAKRVLNLYPKYNVAKKNELKGREFVFQVSNDEESWFLAADNQRILDLWVIQIQMQTKLSRAISGRIFSVKAANTRPLQRIGAKDQQCLLHFTRWGLTLALQESRSVLSLWPLDTIRNYECTGTGQFILEAGRRSPMGEGKYAFFTNEGEDEVMFNVIDVFVTARLESKANLTRNKGNKDVTDDDILAAYDKHHAIVLGAPPPDLFSDDNAYDRIGSHGVTSPVAMNSEKPPSYDHLARTGEIRATAVPSSGPYNQLDRSSSLTSKSLSSSEAGYNTFDRSKDISDSYDHFRRFTADQGAGVFQDKGHYNRFGSYSDDKACISPGNYPLTQHEPSIPNILESPCDRMGFEQRFGSFSSTNSDVVYSNQVSPADQQNPFQPRHNSTGSGLKQRKTTREETTKDDAQLPPPALPAKSNSQHKGSLSLARPVPTPGTSLKERTGTIVDRQISAETTNPVDQSTADEEKGKATPQAPNEEKSEYATIPDV